MDDGLRNYLRRLLDWAAHSAIARIFMGIPLLWAVIALVAIIATVILFKLY